MRPTNETNIEKLYDYIRYYQDEHNFSPSVAEMQKMLGLKSKSGVFAYLNTLVARGKIKRTSDKQRNIAIISPLYKGDISMASEVGSIVCGIPTEEEESYGEKIPLPSIFFGSGDLFMLKARGDSMIDAHIEDGDTLVVERCEIANNGDIVVALVNGTENTLKYFYEENGKVRLEPANEE
ncbi:MAG: transcriptional repressor LexA [Clostridia bacterium]